MTTRKVGRYSRGDGEIPEGEEGDLVGTLCSRNPHDETVVVRRAQWWTKPGHLEARSVYLQS